MKAEIEKILEELYFAPRMDDLNPQGWQKVHINKAELSIKQLIEGCVPKEKEPFWIKQEGSLDTCAGCGEHYICNCKGWNACLADIKENVGRL